MATPGGRQKIGARGLTAAAAAGADGAAEAGEDEIKTDLVSP